ncbi:MAG: RsmE family RNA methyltransferase, partial [Leptotrichiaceae bacterium]
MLTAIIEKQYISKDKIKVVEKADINHISNVYRLGIGDQVRVIDGEYEYLTKIIELSKKEILLEIEQKNEDIYSLNINIDIALGILKNDKMNLAIQKLTEIGIRKIVPLHTERVIVKLNEKKEKWETIANETLKQCKGVKFTEVSPISKF